MTRTLRRVGSWIGAMALVASMGSCASARDEQQPEPSHSSTSASTEIKNTFITDWIEIDDIDEGSGDANLFAGTGPADPNLPVGGAEEYIDWDELVRDGDGAIDPDKLLAHQELDDMGAKDASAFPQSNSCVGAASVLSKMDLTYASVANNNAYVYLGVQRAKNNGDAAYYWLFTKKAPRYAPSEANSCSSGLDLIYDVSGPGDDGSGDVLVRGLFRPSADEPALELFQATREAAVPAVDVIDIELTVDGGLLWKAWEDPSPDPGDDVVVAVNTSPTEAGALGFEGVISREGSLLGEHIFAEGAVPLMAFTGDSPCGESYWASVLSRPSHSPTSDPKDLIRPFQVNFGKTEATPILTPSCTLETTFGVEAKGADGELIPANELSCQWIFAEGIESSACSGKLDLPPGTYAASVRVVDLRNDCDDTETAPPVTVYAPLAVEPGGQNRCEDPLGFGLCATPSGGSGSYDLSWSFDPGGVTAPITTPACGDGFGIAQASASGEHTATARLADTGRADGLECPITLPVKVTAFTPLAATLAADTEVCSDSATFRIASASGGDGTYGYDWNLDACDGLTSCVVNPDDSAMCTSGGVSVTVSDGSGVCESVPLSGTFEKQTSMTTCIGSEC